jgi:hypothetical protein
MRTLTLAFLAPVMLTSVAFALAQSRADGGEGASTYREFALFSEVVGDTRFVGAFETAPNRCDVTLFQAAAADALLTGPLRRMVLPIAAGAQGLLGAGPGAALSIACGSHADTISITPRTGEAFLSSGQN